MAQNAMQKCECDPCCPEFPPEFLTATVNNISGCECIDGLSFQIQTFEAVRCQWQGGDEYCDGQQLWLTFDLPEQWGEDCKDVLAGLLVDSADCEFFDTPATLVSLVCEPLNAVFEIGHAGGSAPTCCDKDEGPIAWRITITE